MKTSLRTLLGGALALVFVSPVLAQGWGFDCIDPENTAPISDDFNTLPVGNALIGANLGLSGTVTFGGQNGPCFGPTARTEEVVGRIAFFNGPVGSVQPNPSNPVPGSEAFDNNLALTFGAPAFPWIDATYGNIVVNGATEGTFGDGGLRTAFRGASDRYIVGAWTSGSIDVELEIRVLGDAVRLRWRMRNLDPEEAITANLNWVMFPGMRTGSPFVTDNFGRNQFLTGIPSLSTAADFVGGGYNGLVTLPTGRPVRNYRNYASTSLNFPPFAKFLTGQEQAYGIRLDNIPGTSTPDATPVVRFAIGDYFINAIGNSANFNVFGDATGQQEEADVLIGDFVSLQEFETQIILPGDFADTVHYVRAPWSAGVYTDPYTLVLDAPRVIGAGPQGQDGLQPNPFTVRVWLDNQYATLDREIRLNNVQFTIILPDGLNLAPGETQSKIVNTIAPNALAFVDFLVESDGVTFGELPITVSVSPTPGPTRNLQTTTRVSAVPRLRLFEGPNLVTFPYNFDDTSLNAILDLQPGVDYLAFRWDPNLLTYTPVASAERGAAYWIVPTSDLGFRTLEGAQIPGDTGTGGLLYSLDSGWNLFGNPTPFAIPLGQLIAVAEENPNQVFTWGELVQQGIVNSAVISYNPETGEYEFLQGVDALLEPHKGYWVFVNTQQPVRLSWPPVFFESLPNAGRSPEVFRQTERDWRLQISARNSRGIDSHNFIGLMRDANVADQNRIPKPPQAPNAAIEVAIIAPHASLPTRSAQVIGSGNGRQEFRVEVRSEVAGEVTLTWPNLPSIPRNARVRLIDPATNERRDLRATSGYTFTMSEPGTREFIFEVDQAGAARPVIGNVVVSTPSREAGAPITVTYALSAEALVTARVLNSSGTEVFTLTRGRSDTAGENTVTWNLRDNANRAVAPGTYQVEIIAETPNGERVRRTVPVNVIR